MRWSNFLIQRATSYALEQLFDSASNFVCAGATFVDFVIFRRCECLFFKKCRTYVAEIAIIYLSSSSDFLISLTFSDDKLDRKSTRLNSSHVAISYAVFCLKKK